MANLYSTVESDAGGPRNMTGHEWIRAAVRTWCGSIGWEVDLTGDPKDPASYRVTFYIMKGSSDKEARQVIFSTTLDKIKHLQTQQELFKALVG